MSRFFQLRLLLVLLAMALLGACGGQPDGRLRRVHSALPAPADRPTLALEPVADLDLPGIPRSLLVSGDALYVFMNQEGLATVDLTNPGRPRLVGHLAGNDDKIVPGKHLYYSGRIDGERLVVADRHYGITTLDLADPLRPRLLDTLPIPGNQPIHVERIGADYFVSSASYGLIRLTGEPGRWTSAAQVIGNVDNAKQSAFYPPHYLVLVDDHDGGIRIFDLRLPERPVLLQAYVMGGFCDFMRVFDGFVVLSLRQRGIEVIDMSDPTRPHLASGFQYSQFNGVRAMERWGENRLVVGYDSGAIDIFDLADPARPLWLGRFAVEAPVYCLAVHGDLLLVGLHRQERFDRRPTPPLRILRLVELPKTSFSID